MKPNEEKKQEKPVFCGKCSDGYVVVFSFKKYFKNRPVNTSIMWLRWFYDIAIPCACSDKELFLKYLKQMQKYQYEEPEVYEMAHCFLHNFSNVEITKFNVANYYGVGQDIQLTPPNKIVFVEYPTEKRGLKETFQRLGIK